MTKRHYSASRYSMVLREVVAAKSAGMSMGGAIAGLTILQLDPELAIQLWAKA